MGGLAAAGCFLIVTLSACGRIGYERPLGDAGTDGGHAGRDSGGGSGGLPCTFASTPTCPNGAVIRLGAGTHTIGRTTGGLGDLFAGSCGGAGAEESTHLVTALSSGTYRFRLEPSYGVAMYTLDGECGGAETECSLAGAGSTTDWILGVTAGDAFTLVIDGQDGQCGAFMLTIERQ